MLHEFLTEHRDGIILTEVEDECGGRPEGRDQTTSQPFEKGTNSAGFGPGLEIGLDAVVAYGGEIHVRNMPGKGWVVSMSLPPVE